MSSTVLVTGGAGFIGAHLVPQLLDRGDRVRILDNMSRGDRGRIAAWVATGRVELVEQDIRYGGAVHQAMAGCDRVVHLAAVSINKSEADPYESVDINVVGSNNVFKAAADHGVRRVVFASSASVYGDPETLPMAEDGPLHPLTPYCIAKHTGEQLLDYYSRRSELTWIALRFFNVYGPGQKPTAYYTSVINHFVQRLRAGEPPVIDGEGAQSMDFVHVHDITSKNGKIPNSIKKGFAKAFDKFDGYALAKYRGEGKAYKLIDVVNLCHPKGNERNTDAIAALVKGDLKSFDTWETELTRAGQVATSEEEKAEFKKDVWVKLVKEKKIRYFALLRNLRNIIEQAPEVLPEALTLLADESLIKKSLVLPFRFTTAYEEIGKLNEGKIVRDVLMALNRAVDISVSNVPKFDGETLVVLDVSGSMVGKPSQIGALFSAILIKSNNADFMTFSDSAAYRNVNPMDTTITIADAVNFQVAALISGIYSKRQTKSMTG